MMLPDGLLLADKSAWKRAGDARVRKEWSRAITEGRVVTCLPVRFELLYSTRDAEAFELLETRLAALRDIHRPAPPGWPLSTLSHATRSIPPEADAAHREISPESG
jgi:hypothetical protein